MIESAEANADRMTEIFQEKRSDGKMHKMCVAESKPEPESESES